jgi:outer membrane immunogenic protein
MKMKLLVAAVAGLAGTANAQSAFEGFYGQLGIGYESVSAGFPSGTMTSGGSAGSSYTISSSNANSFVGTVGIGGYFPVTNTFMLGAGAEYSPLAGSSKNYTFTIPAGNYSDTGSFKKKSSYNIFLSPAIAIDKDKLAYAKVGFTGMSIQNTNADGTSNNTETGYSLGLGYKQMIAGSIYAFGEVNYAAYSGTSLGGGASGSTKPNLMNALVGVGYKF